MLIISNHPKSSWIIPNEHVLGHQSSLFEIRGAINIPIKFIFTIKTCDQCIKSSSYASEKTGRFLIMFRRDVFQDNKIRGWIRNNLLKNRLVNTHYFCAWFQNSIWLWSSLSGIVRDLFGSFLEFLAFASLAFRFEVELNFQVFVFHQFSAVGCTTAFLFTR